MYLFCRTVRTELLGKFPKGAQKKFRKSGLVRDLKVGLLCTQSENPTARPTSHSQPPCTTVYPGFHFPVSNWPPGYSRVLFSVVKLLFGLPSFSFHLHEVSRLTLALASLILPDLRPGPFQTLDGVRRGSFFRLQPTLLSSTKPRPNGCSHVLDS